MHGERRQGPAGPAGGGEATITSRFETLWEEFVEAQRRLRAPEELHRRVRAAISEAAEVGSWGELLRAEPRAESDTMPIRGGAIP